MKLLKVVLLSVAAAAHACAEFPDLKFHQTEETLLRICEIIMHKQKGAYLRFGDGDVNLANGRIDMLQRPNPALAAEMCEAFALQGDTVLKTLNLYCRELGGFEEGMFRLNHEEYYHDCINTLNKAAPIWGGPIQNVYSHAALHFAATEYPDFAVEFLKFLRNSDCFMLVGNKDIPQRVRDVLFGEDCLFVPTPKEQSYNEIDRIEAECARHLETATDYKIVITAMGCSGRALQKRLWNRFDNIFLFDFGSLMDAVCGWKTRAWINVTHFNGPDFLRRFKQSLDK